MEPLAVLLFIAALIILYPSLAKREGRRLTNYWLQMNDYSANEDEIKTWWFLGPDRFPVQEVHVTFIATNRQGEKFSVKLRIGSSWVGLFLGTPELLSLEKLPDTPESSTH